MKKSSETQQSQSLKNLFSPDFTFTKRQIGIVLVLVGIVGFIGILAIDVVRGDNSGIGPAQMLGLAGMVVCGIFGATLIPLGDDPV
ncbi:MAG: hypothetical protein ACPG7F_16450 [Aggregatilineales bacterium]